MLKSALFAALARLALGLSKTLMKSGFKPSKKFLQILTKEMGLGNPIKWAILCAGLSSYRLLQQVLLMIIEPASWRTRRALEVTLEKPGKSTRVLASFGAGMLASLPFFALNVHTRTELALYLCIRAAHGVACAYWEALPLPEPIKRFNHYDVVVMGVTSAEIIYSLVMQANAHLAGYQDFLLGNTKMPQNATQVIAALMRGQYVPEAFGIDQNYGRLGRLTAGGEVGTDMGLVATTEQLRGRFDPSRFCDVCAYTHPQVSSCIVNYLQYLVKHITTVSIPLYLPLKLMATLVFGMKKLKKDPAGVVVKLGKGILSSSMFLTLYASAPVGSVCAAAYAGVTSQPLLFAISGFLSAMATFLEPKGRRLDLALYCSVQTLRSFTRILYYNGYIPRPNHHWIFVLQTTAVGLVLYQYDNHADIMHPNLKGTLGWLLNERNLTPADKEVELLSFLEPKCEEEGRRQDTMTGRRRYQPPPTPPVESF